MIKKINKIFSGVYLLHDSFSKIYKIGQSGNCLFRFNSHKTSNPNITFIGIIQTEDRIKLEKEIHKKFKQFSYKLEWFFENQSILEYFENNEQFVKSDLIINSSSNIIIIKNKVTVFDKNNNYEQVSLISNTNTLKFLKSEVSEKIKEQIKTSNCVIENDGKFILAIDKFNESEFYTFLQKFYKKGIFFYAICYNEGIRKRIYTINPDIGRTPKGISKNYKYF